LQIFGGFLVQMQHNFLDADIPFRVDEINEVLSNLEMTLEDLDHCTL